jgi:thiamine transporter
MKKSSTLVMVEGAIMIALATVLSYIRVYKLPWGGSITLFSMLPIALYSIKYGVKRGLEAGFLFSLIQLGQGVIDGLFGWGLTKISLVGCILFDYILPFTLIGLAGMLRKKGAVGWIVGTVAALLIRFACHFTTGVIIWKTFGELWDGFSTDNTYLYSLLYNGSYMLPEIILTAAGAFAAFKIPVIRKHILSTIDD